MYTPPKIILGTLSAEEDRHFQDHFIETKYLKRLNSFESDIVYGTKGVGKTALRKALTEIYDDNYYETVTIDLDSISFEAVYNKLVKLNSTIKHEMHILARTTWMNTLISYALLAFSQSLENSNYLRHKITNALKEDGFIKPNDEKDKLSSNFRLLNTIENIFQKIASLAVVEKITFESLTAEQQDIVNRFPINENITNSLNEAINIIKKSKKKVLVCIDGFDTVVKHNTNSREAIFAGLIDSIYRFRLDPLLSEAFCFKAFLPQELTLEANSIMWDSDKHAKNVHYLSWTENDFKAFIQKRLFIYSKKKSNKFNDLWLEFMPEKIFNNVHGVEESTFDYIVRHTLYRPRQVLDHIQTIFTNWEETNSTSDKIQASFIPQAIAKNNNFMAGKIADHLSKIYPNIVNFLKSFQGSPSIFEAKKLRDKISRYFMDQQQESSDSDKLFDDFFNFGLFGIRSKTPTNSTSKKINFRFSFVGDNLNSYIHNSTLDTDLIAFAPMFREFCGFQPSSQGLIIPISLENFDS